MSDPLLMRDGLLATKQATATTVGTITLDSYTRVGDHTHAEAAMRRGVDLNGYPIVAHSSPTTAAVLDGVLDSGFPVQVRHGSAAPLGIIRALITAGLHATEGGPVSYCLPYSRTPLREAVAHWADSCELLAAAHPRAHLESFGGCMMGQLCPPSLLVALSVLECMFFAQHGITSVSLSYTQQTNAGQDEEAVRALRLLTDEFLGDLDRHIVIYAYMGVYPRTRDGASALLRGAARLAMRTGAERLIVKTVAEAHRIPTIAENVEALETAAVTAAAAQHEPVDRGSVADTGILAEARALISAVLNIDQDVGSGLIRAFRCGYLDVPFCLHPDNPGRTRAYIDEDGRLRWSRIGALPIGGLVDPKPEYELTAPGLLSALTYVERTFDGAVRKHSEPYLWSAAGTAAADHTSLPRARAR